MKKASKRIVVTMVVDKLTDPDWVALKVGAMIARDKFLASAIHRWKVEAKK